MKYEFFFRDLNLLGKIYSSGRGFVPEIEKKDNILVIYDYCDDEYYDYNQCVKRSKKTIDIEKIIIKFSENTWYGDLVEWYNNTDEENKKMENGRYSDEYKEHYKTYKLLNAINSKNYISIIEPFMEIHIDAKIKGSKITIDDVLFATRGLCIDHQRNINSFTEIKKTKKMLILEPDIDNFSS
jgi:hypothetical protein